MNIARARTTSATTTTMPAIHGTNGANLDFGSVAPSRTAAIGGTRVARIAGNRPAASVMPTPTTSATITVRSAKTRSAVGSSTPRARKSPSMPSASRTPRPRPTSEASEADDERLEDHRAEDLAARRADRPQRGELARSLRDGDRERVEDDERSDEEGDTGEDEEEVAEDRRELVHLVHLLLGLRRRAHDLRRLREHGLDGRDELVLRDAFARRDRDRVVPTLAVEELLRSRDREHREARIPEAVEAAVLRDPDELERALRLEGRDLDGVADRVALVVRGADVDDDLVRRSPANGPRGRSAD